MTAVSSTSGSGQSTHLAQPGSKCSSIGAGHSACLFFTRLLRSMAPLGQGPPQVDCPLLGAHQEGTVDALQSCLSLHSHGCSVHTHQEQLGTHVTGGPHLDCHCCAISQSPNAYTK